MAAPMTTMPPLQMDVEGHELEVTSSGKSYKYQDFSNVAESDQQDTSPPPLGSRDRSNKETPQQQQVQQQGQQDDGSIRVKKFPVKLYAILGRKEFHDIITWLPHGRSWKVLKPNLFESQVMPLFFENSNYHSFNRLINAWSFRRMTSGPDRGSYYHELFLRGKPHLQNFMRRLPKTHKKLPMRRQDEPDFHLLHKTNPLPELEGGSLKCAPSTSNQKQPASNDSVPISALLNNLPCQSQPSNPISGAAAMPTLCVDGLEAGFGNSASSGFQDSFSSLFSLEDGGAADLEAHPEQPCRISSAGASYRRPDFLTSHNMAGGVVSNNNGNQMSRFPSANNFMGRSNGMNHGNAMPSMMPLGPDTDLEAFIQQHQQQMNRLGLNTQRIQDVQQPRSSMNGRFNNNNNMKSSSRQLHQSMMMNNNMMSTMGNSSIDCDLPCTPSSMMCQQPQQQQQQPTLVEPTPLLSTQQPPQTMSSTMSFPSSGPNTIEPFNMMDGGSERSVLDPSLMACGGNNNFMNGMDPFLSRNNNNNNGLSYQY
eukprot:CAMPEP_0172442360 /NCGR_PEP_ID=MMETSP1065-20121228/2812_1 /TAXON_ID=265537 /ORGANISM="Amphiprora paludosa, Strain CCMP125" /LENGTH=535 /DNA_ID=CAMNT_0013192197 /DNA_START=88 /DNA_END=1695 /DNA_ORIENTATION=+